MKIEMESNDARVSNVHISNAYGDDDESMLDYYGGNAVFENITIENIPSSTYMEWRTVQSMELALMQDAASAIQD